MTKTMTKTTQYKPGALSKEDQEYIRQNSRLMPVEHIAARLNRRPAPIRRYITEHFLPSTELSTEEHERQVIVGQLHQRRLWNECVQQFTEDELEYFESIWVDMMRQLNNDVLPSEELQLKKFISYEILRDRCLKIQAKSMHDLQDAEDDLKREKLKPANLQDPAVIAALRETINSIRSAYKVYTSEFAELSDKQERIANALRASRDNRIKRVDDAKVSFTGLLKMLEDEKEREKLGREIDLIDKARQKKEGEMSEYFEFCDGEVDKILINSDNVEPEDVNE